MKKGLAPQTQKIFDAITQLDCIKPFVLVGGTALSLQLGTRQSEDLDFTILKSGVPIQELIPMALEHSGHRLKEKNLLAMITNGEYFIKDSSFAQLNPLYNVTAADIQEFIKGKLYEAKANKE